MNLQAIRHRISHILGWNAGTLTMTCSEDKLIVSFRCNGCGRENEKIFVTDLTTKEGKEFLNYAANATKHLPRNS